MRPVGAWRKTASSTAAASTSVVRPSMAATQPLERMRSATQPRAMTAVQTSRWRIENRNNPDPLLGS